MDPVEVKSQSTLFVIFPEIFWNSDQNFRIFFYPSQKSFSHETVFSLQKLDYDAFCSVSATYWSEFTTLEWCVCIRQEKAFGYWERVHLRWKTRLKPVFHFLHFSYNEVSLLSLKRCNKSGKGWSNTFLTFTSSKYSHHF